VDRESIFLLLFWGSGVVVGMNWCWTADASASIFSSALWGGRLYCHCVYLLIFKPICKCSNLLEFKSILRPQTVQALIREILPHLENTHEIERMSDICIGPFAEQSPKIDDVELEIVGVRKKAYVHDTADQSFWTLESNSMAKENLDVEVVQRMSKFK